VQCPRFNAQLDFIYHPERLTHPLKCTGERGSGSFKQISWDEALDTVASSLQKVKDKYGPEAVAFYIAYTRSPPLFPPSHPRLRLAELFDRKQQLRHKPDAVHMAELRLAPDCFQITCQMLSRLEHQHHKFNADSVAIIS